ncbi:E3 ubiquitin-protein ligase HECTD3 [Platysternon megacephalum]|uniref:E3 ubiquitin-protein ligase HECTD3 n=1 Tax=Platysternon megacephalum TaxID=55544 RepID=A0A4D9E3X5_9SAUR|nr:E3 ubiquitin-protein ligase HECTD3 [Platysternon megacephalum]
MGQGGGKSISVSAVFVPAGGWIRHSPSRGICSLKTRTTMGLEHGSSNRPKDHQLANRLPNSCLGARLAAFGARTGEAEAKEGVRMSSLPPARSQDVLKAPSSMLH